MWPKIRIALTSIPAFTFILVAVMTWSGMDSGGDLPGLLRVLLILVSVAVWSVLFSVSMAVYAIQKKHFRLLGMAAVLLLARILFFSEVWWANSVGHMYLWLPVEYIVFYFAQHADNRQVKCILVFANAGLYALALCLLVLDSVLRMH